MREILKKKITKSEVVQMHRDKWNWIADYIEKEKSRQFISGLESKYMIEHGKEENYNPCCEYNNQFNKYIRSYCTMCPIDWEAGGSWRCLVRGSLYMRISSQKYWEDQVKMARQIANLPEREDDPNISEVHIIKRSRKDG